MVHTGECWREPHLRDGIRRHARLLGRQLGRAGDAAGRELCRRFAAAGGLHTCNVRSDGTLACWGRNDYGQSTPPVGTFAQVSAGGEHNCGVKTAGTLACWGYDFYGQATPAAGTFTQVSAGRYHNCAVKTNSTLDCWGDNTYGQSQDAGGTFTQVSAGGSTAAA